MTAPPPRDSPNCAPEPSSPREIILFSCLGVGPPYSGNRTRQRELLKALRALGHEVDFVGIGLSPTEYEATRPYVRNCLANLQYPSPPPLIPRIARKLRDLRGRLRFRGTNQEVDRWFYPPWARQIRSLFRVAEYDTVIASYVFHSKVLDYAPRRCHRILDTHDRFSYRTARLAQVGVVNPFFDTCPQQEAAGLLRADDVLAIQEEEAVFFEVLLKGRRAVHVVPHLIDRTRPIAISPVTAAQQHTVGYIAARTNITVASIQWFLEYCLPRIRAVAPATRVLIAGSVCDALAPCQNVALLGHVPDLGRFYGQVGCVINPMLAGTGLKIKTVEAFEYSRAVVCTTEAAAGLPMSTSHFAPRADTQHDFADTLLAMLGRPDTLTRLGREARRFVVEWDAASRDTLAAVLCRHRRC